MLEAAPIIAHPVTPVEAAKQFSAFMLTHAFERTKLCVQDTTCDEGRRIVFLFPFKRPLARPG